MDLYKLKSVLVLAEKLNFTRTAESLNMVQPALSRQIAQVEDEIGALIFSRNKRNVQLTEAGKYFVSEIDALLAHLDRITTKTRDIHEGKAGEIKIGFTHSVMQTILPEILRTIRRELPGIKTILREMNNHDQYWALQHDELDLGLATNPMIPPNLMGKVMYEDKFAVLLPADHEVDEDSFEDFSVFSNEEFIFPSPTDGLNYVRTVESICIDAGFQPRVVHETDSASTSFRLVEAGIGISIEPVSSLRGHELPIKSIELNNIRQKAELTMMWSPDREKEYPLLFEKLQSIKV